MMVVAYLFILTFIALAVYVKTGSVKTLVFAATFLILLFVRVADEHVLELREQNEFITKQNKALIDGVMLLMEQNSLIIDSDAKGEKTFVRAPRYHKA